MFHKILVALDQSDVSQQVLHTAIALAKTLNAQMMLAHILSPAQANYPLPVFAVQGAYPLFRGGDLELHLQQLRTVEAAGLEFLKAKTDLATAAGISTEFTQAMGDPGQAICALARTWDANLIIIGRRGYKGIGEFLMGSVSSYVMHHASCSVLTVQGTVDLVDSAPATSPSSSHS